VENASRSETAPGTGDPAPAPAALSLEGVSVRYPGTGALALAEVTLAIRAGEVAALLGANGAGKSTLLRVAAGLVRPTTGAARIDGADLRTLGRQAVARRIAFVAQSADVSRGFLVREVVAMGRAPHQGIWMRESADDRDAIAEAIARCDLTHLAERRVEALSGGEQRRVAIARALAQRPRVLLLDEPAAFLDVRHRLSLHELLAEVASRDHVACAVATHDLDATARFASRAVLMRGGLVVASGPTAEVMDSSHLEAIFDAEILEGVHDPSGRRYFVPVRPTPRAAQRG
jgi:iron complex transport system ATP-binding protein